MSRVFGATTNEPQRALKGGVSPGRPHRPSLRGHPIVTASPRTTVERESTRNATKHAIQRDVAYCAQTRLGAFAKENKANKVLRTKPSHKDFILITLQAAKDSRSA